MRYNGPLFRKSRRYKYSLLETNKEFIKGSQRTTVPGQHGPTSKQKLTGYGTRLYEKQKLAFMYGLNERQLRNLFVKASKMKGPTGNNLFSLLESRLDNLVYRMGFASTRRQARQFVTHGLVIVNGKKVDIASYICEVGDEIEIRQSARTNKFITENMTNAKPKLFVELDTNNFKGKFVRLPNRDELTQEIKEGFVVEFYSK